MTTSHSRALDHGGSWVEDAAPPPERTTLDTAPTNIRRFVLNRTEDITGLSGTGVVAEGARFTDGTAVMRWLTDTRSTVLYDSVDDLIAIHGHEGATTVAWVD